MKSRKILIIFLFLSLFCWTPLASASSGACSSHGGVNCAAGRQPNGNVYCNDAGWTGSMVSFDFMEMCKTIPQNNLEDWRLLAYKQYTWDCKVVSKIHYFNGSISKEYCPSNSIFDDFSKACICDIGYYNYNYSEIVSHECRKGEPPVHSIVSVQLIADKFNDEVNGIERTDLSCQRRYPNSVLINNDCKCEPGYRFTRDAYEKNVICVKREDYDQVIISEQIKYEQLKAIDNNKKSKNNTIEPNLSTAINQLAANPVNKAVDELSTSTHTNPGQVKATKIFQIQSENIVVNKSEQNVLIDIKEQGLFPWLFRCISHWLGR